MFLNRLFHTSSTLLQGLSEPYSQRMIQHKFSRSVKLILLAWNFCLLYACLQKKCGHIIMLQTISLLEISQCWKYFNQHI